MVGNLIAWDLDFDLRKALDVAGNHLSQPMSPESQENCLDFIVERQRNLLLESGNRFDVVDAVLSTQGHNPSRAVHAVKALSAWVERPDWHDILPAYARCVRITRDLEELFPVDAERFDEPVEADLHDSLAAAEAEQRGVGSVDDFLNAFLPMIPTINRFFDQVLVMSEDRMQRENRLGLLQRIAALADGVADMSKLEGF
jgi:glycyl-tRNA synthetase